MHQLAFGRPIKGFVRTAAFNAIFAVLVFVTSHSATAGWEQNCSRDIQRAMANLTVVWKHLNAKRQIIDGSPQYIFRLKDSERCAPIWKMRIKSYQEDGSFVWWSRSAVFICEAGQRMSTERVAKAKDSEVIAFWRRRLWRYGHCITAGRRIMMGMDG